MGAVRRGRFDSVLVAGGHGTHISAPLVVTDVYGDVYRMQVLHGRKCSQVQLSACTAW